MKKQLAYADARKIPYVALVGTEEMKNGQVTLKDMQKGEQSTITFEELLHVLK